MEKLCDLHSTVYYKFTARRFGVNMLDMSKYLLHMMLLFADFLSLCQNNPCQRFGKCVEGLTSYYCDCNMTAHIGRYCDEGTGLTFLFAPSCFAYSLLLSRTRQTTSDVSMQLCVVVPKRRTVTT